MVDRDDYPDYDFWSVNDPNYPYPIPNDIQVFPSSYPEAVASASGTVVIPTAIPYEKTIAERSAGIAHSWRFTIAVIAERTARGVKSEIVCTAQHVNFFPDHGETSIGAEQTFRLDPNNIAVNRTESILQDSPHAPQHYDRVTFMYKRWPDGTVSLDMVGGHRSRGRIGEPDVPRVAPPGGSPPPPPGGGTPPEDKPDKTEIDSTISLRGKKKPKKETRAVSAAAKKRGKGNSRKTS